MVYAQRETNVWYFGNHAGLDFNTPEPKILTDGQTHQWENFGQNAAEFEGVATFSDSLGNLLFYTDGRTIWNKNHEIMADDLLGHQSSTESAIIVPWPQSNSKYYVFVVDEHGGDGGLSYSVVDMQLNNGLGAIVDGEKNNIIANPVCEKVTAIRHKNNVDIWLLTKSASNNSIIEWKITKDGLQESTKKQFPISVINHGQIKEQNENVYKNTTGGYMRVSPNGKYIACAITGGLNFDGEKDSKGLDVWYSVLECYVFDTETGIVEKKLIIKDYNCNLYGVEFSNDASKLYYTTRVASSIVGGNGLNYVYQVDLTLPTINEIEQSAIVVGECEPNDFRDFPGALQFASNGKIYVALENSQYLGVINNPRERGEDCNFDEQGVWLGGGDIISKSGLPNFIPSYFVPPDFTVNGLCSNGYTVFTCNDTREIESFDWKIYSLPDNKIIAQSNEESFSLMLNEGYYRVSMTIKDKVFHQEYSDYRIVKIFNPPEFQMLDIPLVCNGTSINYGLVDVEDCQVWFNDFPDTKTLEISNPQTIYQTAKNMFTGCVYENNYDIQFIEPQHFSLGDDLHFCFGDSINYTCELNFIPKSFCWLDTASENVNRTFRKSGIYAAQTIDQNNCSFVDEFQIFQNSLPNLALANDTIICKNGYKILDCGVENADYQWNNGETTQQIMVENPGLYKIKVTDKNNCVAEDSITLISKSLPEFSLPSDTVLCENEFLNLNIFNPEAENYFWQDFSTSPEYEISTDGLYIASSYNVCGSVTDSILVSYKYCGEFIFPNIITPNGDGINDYFKIKGLENTSDWEMVIFNREGVNVFKSSNYRNDWNAHGLSDGVYFYIMQKNGQKFTGNVTVFQKRY